MGPENFGELLRRRIVAGMAESVIHAEDVSINLDGPLLATALVSAGYDDLEEKSFPGN